jgi:hypothetical protein
MNSSSKFSRLRVFGLLTAAGIFSCAIFLLLSSKTAGIGFPLDDAWIHQTYARNLAERGEWAFIPGQVSAGSTAPLWSVLLALGRFFGGETPYAWTYLLGGGSLIGMGIVGQMLYNRGLGTARFPWVGLFLAGEWHLVWAALSGMETALMGLIILLFFWWMGRSQKRWEVTGLLIGLAVWIRPDGLTLLGPAVLVIIACVPTWRSKFSAALRLAVGVLLLFLPYLLFNQLVTGSVWPNTFYAKQAEYAALREQTLLLRLWQQYSLPLTGAGIFLVPGFFYAARAGWRKRDWVRLAAAIGFVGYAGLYALRLPVIYQHGRYLIPAMPVYFWIGLAGTAGWLGGLAKTRLTFIFSRVFGFSLGLVWLAFIWIGARAYAQDVAVIETEMVAAARWTSMNTAPDALVAAHDIGALGYFGRRQLVDLAGLVSPEVIPFIRDETQLKAYLDERQVSVLVTFPGWYPRLIEGKEAIFQTGGNYAPLGGGENMVVYRWK